MDTVSQLRNDIDELRNSLMSKSLQSVAPPDDLSSAQSLLVRSFVILAHAHIEEFIEQMFSDFIAAKTLEITDETIPACYARLILHFGENIRGEKGSSGYAPGQLCLTAKSMYESKVIKANNGLKEKNVTQMARPLGLTSDEVSDACPDLFPALDTLGSKRGRLAHRSSQAVSETIYPGQAIKWVEDVLTHFAQLSNLLSSSQGVAASLSTP
ncbi:HEPN domain-containing protein [Streptomyces sp. NPDC087845]|uniref:HEPN domain-containing protein n=1 Tax=Streptomyces sp. NPDC087845 TaxID=3365806 RepID=UPI00380C3706